MSDGHVFMRCVPSPEVCLKPNEKDYSDDKRINELKKILSNHINNLSICKANCFCIQSNKSLKRADYKSPLFIVLYFMLIILRNLLNEFP